MKIIAAKDSDISNFEVYQHMLNEDYKFRQPDRKREVPRSVKNLVKEMLEYFHTAPNPTAQKPITYNGFTIRRLITRTEQYDLAKGEVMMILNIRPENAAVLSTCIEDMTTRFTEEQINEIQAVIEEVLGPFPPKEYQADEEMVGA